MTEREAYRAINQHRYSHPRWGRRPFAFRVTTSSNGFTVKDYRPRKLYANHKGHHLAKFSHLTRFGWRAYDAQGRLRLTCIRFLCGGTSTNMVLADEPTLPVCVKCRVVLVGYDEAARALDTLNPN